MLVTMRRLVVRPEYGAGPIWDDAWDGHTDICPDPASLGISTALAAELTRWQADYDETLDQAYPPDSRFVSDAARLDWEQRGVDLSRRLQVELGEAAIVRLDLPGAGAS
jgi:hypothetical protein